MKNGASCSEERSQHCSWVLMRLLVLLLDQQEILYGTEHPDIGGTCADLADALDFLLGTSPKALFKSYPSWGDFPRASKARQHPPW